MADSVITPLGYAWRQMKLVCFGPFNLGKWFVLGFCAWLAYLGQGGWGGSGPSGNFGQVFQAGARGPGGPGHPGYPGGAGGAKPDQFLRDVGHWVTSHLPLVIALGVLVITVMLIVGLVVGWLHARGKFMFLDGVVKNRTAVVEPWRQYKKVANSLFLFNVVYGLIMMLVLGGLVLLGVALAWHDIRAEQFGVGAGLAVLLIIPLLIVIFVGAIITRLLEDFVVPIMYRGNLRVLAAWGVLRREILPGNVGNLILFYLLRWLIGMAIGAGLLVAMCATCCVAWCLVALPYVGTVALLPMLVFRRSWSVFMLGAMNPAWRILGDPDEGKCAKCGYDLRASTGQCPECGTPIPPGQAPAGPVDPYAAGGGAGA